MSKILTVGTRVRWTSTSQGYTKTKEGVIEVVVAPGHTPNNFAVIPDNQLRKFTSNPRDHVSYIVRVRSRTFYWPLVKNLTVAEDAPAGRLAREANDRKAIQQGLADSAAGRVEILDFSAHAPPVQQPAPLQQNADPLRLLLEADPTATPAVLAGALINRIRGLNPDGDYAQVGIALAKALVDGNASLEELVVTAYTIKGDLRKALQLVREKKG